MSALKILVIDDDRDLLSAIDEILSAEGHLVIQASSSEEACEALDVDRYDLVVSDINMPGLDGYDLMKILYESGVRSPTIAMSGFIDPIACREAGFSMAIPKPFSSVALLGVVNALTFVGAPN